MSGPDGWSPDADTLRIMWDSERQWAVAAGHEEAEFSDWRRDRAERIDTETLGDETVVTRYDNGGFVCVGPARRVA